MFSNLFNYGFTRNGKQAFGFYISHFILMVLIGVFAGSVYDLISGVPDFNAEAKNGNVLAILICVCIAIATVVMKKM